ncbi:MAG TPA: TIM barrel protein [Longimicrobiales bacterium]
MLAGAAGAAVAPAGAAGGAAAVTERGRADPRSHAPGRLRQSVCRWPFASIPLPAFCRSVVALGLGAIDLLAPEEWQVAADHGLTCSMGYPAVRRDFITRGLNDPANHALLLGELERALPLAARHGVPNVIAMFGNRNGRSDAAGIDACVAALARIAPLAEQERVTICIELLNSRVDHADYQGDRTAFGVEVVSRVGSPRVKLLYDIYHMQVMEGDVIRTIRTHAQHIAHFHTAGVPGRHELDDAQELNYRGIAAAIADLGFDGWFAHEFIPTRAPLEGLRAAIETCTV